ncbi:MAG: adenosine kinase [Bacteroidales bacterium]|nr:adenosine kinase [Bacteroidales bacterium]
MQKVLGIGNALVDVIIKVKDELVLEKYSLPKGSMQLVDNGVAEMIEKDTRDHPVFLASGGSGSNTIHGLAKLGIKTGYIGKTGKDTHGEFFSKDMDKAGITPYLGIGNAPTGRAMTIVTPDSERTFATYLGSAIELTAEDFLITPFKDYSLLHVEGYLVPNKDLVYTMLKEAKKAGMTVSLDMASYNVVEANLDFLKEIVKEYVDIVFANEEEAYAFTGKNPLEAAGTIAQIAQYAVVKTGKSGSIIKHKNEIAEIGVIKASCIDTTGAGDLYASGFLYGYLNHLSLQKCGELGALLAGKVIENLGAKIPETTWPVIYKLKEEIELK